MSIQRPGRVFKGPEVSKPLRAWAVIRFVGPLVQVGRGRHSSFEWGY